MEEFHWSCHTAARAYRARSRCKRCQTLRQYAYGASRTRHGLSPEEWLALHEPKDAFRELDRLVTPNFSCPDTTLPRGRTEYCRWLQELLEQVYYPSLEGDAA